MAKKKRNKDISIASAIRQLDKQYGKGCIIKGRGSYVFDGECISTGSFSLDCALGGRGLPFGRIVEVYGKESSGKTTCALEILANVQKKKYSSAFIDVEHALDPKYAESLGVDMEDLLVSQPDYGEQALQIVHTLVDAGVKIIIVDSVAAIVPKAELDGDMGDETIGLQARLMGKALRKLAPAVNKKKCLLIFINQLRDQIGWGKKGQSTPGGKALKYYASVRIDIRRMGTEKEGERSVSNETIAKVVKSKICSPFREGRLFIEFGKGFNKRSEIFYWAKKLKVMKRSGSIYTFGKAKGKGRKGFFKELDKKKKTKKKFVKEVKAAILKAMV